jgi:hypothetical protein
VVAAIVVRSTAPEAVLKKPGVTRCGVPDSVTKTVQRGGGAMPRGKVDTGLAAKM